MARASPQVLFAGLGSMGYPLAGFLNRELPQFCSRPLAVWNRTAATAQRHATEFGTLAASTEDLLAGRPPVDVVISCVAESKDVAEIVSQFGPSLQRGGLWIDCTSGVPEQSRAIAQKLAERGVSYVDAPVSGGPRGAEKGEVAVMVGGEDETVERAMPFLKAFGGKGVTHVGGIGAGNTVKSVNNMLNSMHLLLATESAALLKRAHVDPKIAMEVIGRSSGMSMQIRDRLPQEVLSGRYSYGFGLGLMNKDVQICRAVLDQAALPETALLRQVPPLLHGAVGEHGRDADYTYISKYWQQQLGETLP